MLSTQTGQSLGCRQEKTLGASTTATHRSAIEDLSVSYLSACFIIKVGSFYI